MGVFVLIFLKLKMSDAVHKLSVVIREMQLMDLVHRINDWYMIVIRKMHVSVVA